MDDIIKSLFDFIPEPWRPYLAIALLILYVVTKARSAAKSSKITKMKEFVCKCAGNEPLIGVRWVEKKPPFEKPSLGDRVVDAIF